jgi:hypothetical protein
VVDEAEALTAIDVNGGGDRLALCLAAAREIAWLLRLRDVGGLVAIDFPFVDQRDFRARVDDALRQAISTDRRPVDCLGWTRGGLYELTRTRGGASLAAQMLEPHRPTLSVESAALAALRRVADAEGGRLRLTAAPEVVAWLAGEGRGCLGRRGTSGYARGGRGLCPRPVRRDAGLSREDQGDGGSDASHRPQAGALPDLRQGA